jgi:uncharacterized protein (TIGR03437 family)
VSRTIAGTFPLGDNAAATSALLEEPQAVAVDPAGNIFIADGGNGLIRKVSHSGVISSILGYSGYAYDLKVDSSGASYLAGGNYAYKLTPAGVLTTIAGNGSFAAASGDGGPATSASFNGIYALAVDSTGVVYICDSGNHRIRKVALDGTVSTIAGGNSKGYAGDGGPASGALLNYPRDIAVDAAGNIYVNDYYNDRIRKIGTDGTIKTFAGSGICCSSPDGGLATSAYLSTGPVAADLTGNLYVYDYFTSKVRKVSSSGIISSFAGDGNEGFAGDGGGSSSARFSNVQGLGTDAVGNLYIADTNNERIRMVAGGIITTVVGRSHFGGDGGAATAAFLHRPQGVVAAPDGTIYFTDTVNHRVRKIGTDGKISTIAGTGDIGFSGDGGPATSAVLSYPDSIARDAAGNLYIVDQEDLRVRKITPAGVISTVAGNGQLAYSNDAKGALGSGFGYIMGLAVDSAGNLYLSEQAAGLIKKILPTGGMSTFAGQPQAVGFGGDGGPATKAVFNTPGSLAVDGTALYIADNYGQRIRKIDMISGNISTAAGNGLCCNTGDGGQATQAKVDPLGVVGDGQGGFWFTDTAGVRYVSPTGVITRVSGAFLPGFAGDDAPAGGATAYNQPLGITLVTPGDVILADTYNSRIRKLQANNPAHMDIVSGDKQTGTTGTALDAMIVKLTGTTGVPAGGVTVTFAVASGSADLSAKTSVTDVNGQAGISATPTKAGTLTVSATYGTFTQTFTATVNDAVKPPPATDTPVIAQGGIGQNGFSVPPVQAISTGAITTLYGSNFLAAGTPPAINAVTGGQLSNNLAGVCVTVAGVKAPVFAVAATQVTIEVPVVTPGPLPVQVLRNCGTSTELESNTLTVSAQAATPEFLYLQVKANGTNPVAAVGSDGLYIAPPSVIPGARPAQAGDVLVIYALGLGATDPAQTVGAAATGAAQVTPTPAITIGGVTLAPSDVLYAGVTPGYIGLYQVNLRVPPGVSSGNQPIVIQSGTVQSPAGAYLAIQ